MAETHPIFSQDPNALQIILYYDDISLTASRAKRNKLSMFYFTLRNFNATFRSRVDAISLLAVAQYGVDRVLALLCKELSRLYLPLRQALVAVATDTPVAFEFQVMISNFNQILRYFEKKEFSANFGWPLLFQT